MKNLNITKVDSKGRILIPKHIRKILDIEEGTEIVMLPDGKGEVRILPLVKEKTTKLRFLLLDIPGSLASIASALSHYNINIIMSESRRLSRQNMAEWDVIADISKCDNSMEKVKNVLQKIPSIKNVEVLKE